MSLSEAIAPLPLMSGDGHIQPMPPLIWVWDITIMSSNDRLVHTL
jgi:hypothetical protein